MSNVKANPRSPKPQKWGERHRRFMEDFFESGEAERLSRFVRSRLRHGDEAAAWDIQELAFDRFREFDFVDRRHAISALYTFARQVAYERNRRKHRRPCSVSLEEGHSVCKQAPYDPLLVQETIQVVRQEIDRLPVLQRRVMQKTLDGLSDNNITASLYAEEWLQADIAEDTVCLGQLKCRVKAARAKAKKRLRRCPKLRSLAAL